MAVYSQPNNRQTTTPTITTSPTLATITTLLAKTSTATSTRSQAPNRKLSVPSTFGYFFTPQKFTPPIDSERLHHLQTDSPLVCARKCLRMTECRSFTLSPMERTCKIFKNYYSGDEMPVDATKTIYFVKR
ncbi:hypothetical protein DPMN_140455 [Dreissena polymorpha]|uniref:Apple domain-containing protein n=2 Tax=Dreissena polymorpha TaxID=45954 RepID=A0A9D4G7M3_DREPO|nr:hypothetical protein DPMN_140455 [Dreissena polymorpha]